MGNQKQKWTAEEEEALLAGIAKHGTGKWKNILKDPDFAPQLSLRSNIDLKDKWRNLSVNTNGQGSKEKQRTPKVKAASAAVAAAVAASASATASPNPNALNSVPHVSVPHNASCEMVVDDNPSNNALDGKNAPRYDKMIFDALSAMADANGSELGAIYNFIEQRHEHEIPPMNFRRNLGTRLRKLASQGKLEKVQNCYKIPGDTMMGTKTPTPKQKDVRNRNSNNQGSTISREMVEEAAITAAYKVAEAENKAFLAAEAVKEMERITKVAEETDSFLEIMKEIYEQCCSGEIVSLV